MFEKGTRASPSPLEAAPAAGPGLVPLVGAIVHAMHVSSTAMASGLVPEPRHTNVAVIWPEQVPFGVPPPYPLEVKAYGIPPGGPFTIDALPPV